jgi:hypothetical protein
MCAEQTLNYWVIYTENKKNNDFVKFMIYVRCCHCDYSLRASENLVTPLVVSPGKWGLTFRSSLMPSSSGFILGQLLFNWPNGSRLRVQIATLLFVYISHCHCYLTIWSTDKTVPRIYFKYKCNLERKHMPF